MTRKAVLAFALAVASATPIVLSLTPSVASAQTIVQNQPSGVLSLSAQASTEVPQDVVNITLFYEQEA
ncbi:MAG TPA: hypothetical protein VEI25_15705, partial [Paraburkholderia sp.]|nr:hypothetical protein [Paraburkholderia sp.]